MITHTMGDLYVVEGCADTWQEALKLTSLELLKNDCVLDDFYESCVSREKVYPTGLTSTCPVAIPHTTKEHVKKQAICALRLEKPVKFHRMDDVDREVEVKYVLNLALLDDSEHIKVIAKVINHLKDASFIEKMNQMSISDLRGFLQEKFFNMEGDNE